MNAELLVVSMLVLVGVGSLIGTQAAMNAELGKHLGLAWFTMIFSLVQFAASAIPVGVMRAFGTDKIAWVNFLGPARWVYLAGTLGVPILMGLAFGIPRVGAFAAFAGVLLGQLTTGMIIDHFGWLGNVVQPITPSRVAGLLCLLAGVWLAQPRS